MQTEHVKSHAARPAIEAVLDPLSNAYSKSIDTQLHQEPLWHMHDAELTWSILSTDVNYTVFDVQGPYKDLKNSPLFNLMEPLKLDKTEYPDNLDRYGEVTAHLKVFNSFDEVNDVITTYLGGYLAPEEGRTFPYDNHIPIDSRRVTTGHLMDRTIMKVFFDNGASKSYLNLKFFNRTPCLHNLPRFTTSCPGITMGNGAVVQAKNQTSTPIPKISFLKPPCTSLEPTINPNPWLCDKIIPMIFMIHGHIFEIYTIVCDIEDNLDLVFGMKNMIETEGIINTRTSTYDFFRMLYTNLPSQQLRC